MTVPETIGRYRILKELGRGAVGVVWLAHDTKLDRRVALKTMRPPDSLPAAEALEARARFIREAQAAAKLQHPGIVTIYDVGERGSLLFIAMEYIEGETLQPYTRKGSLMRLDVALELVAQAADALHYAHRSGIVHRDVKPANLMLVGGNTIKIADFGLAKNPGSSVTQEGIILGSPSYMSPEQITGAPLDGRSDIFSLGVVLYELLTGAAPFGGETITTIIYRIMNEQPREVRAINERVPQAAAQMVMKALEKDPAARYQSCAELAYALRSRQAAVATAAIGSRGPAPERPVPWRAGAEALPAREAARPRREPAERAGEHLAAGRGRRIRAPFILAAAIAGVLLLPEGGAVEDEWGIASVNGQTPFYATAAILGPSAMRGPGGGAAAPEPPALALPGDGAVAITVVTEPPGGRIFIDDRAVPGGVLRLSPQDTATHAIVAESDCFIDATDYRLPDPPREATLTIKLKTPKSRTVPVRSTPPGARILLNGKGTGLTTPADLAVKACGPRKVAFRLDGYKDVEATLDDSGSPLDVTLTRIPEGWVTVAAPYPVDLYIDGRRIGASGEPIKLRSGKHAVTARNEELFVQKSLTIDVRADERISHDAALPGIGRLTVLASPGNCRITIDGQDLGAPPINDRRLAEGSYTIRAVYVPTGETKESTVRIEADRVVRVPFKFNP